MEITKNVRSAPIDRGWAWVVVVAAFLDLFIVIGTSKSLGIIFVELIDEYKGSASSTSLMFALSAGISLFAAPLITAATELFTCRVVCMFGGTMLCLAFVVASQSSSLETIVLSYGIIGGVGIGCSLTPVPIVVGRYFEQRRALANGLAFSGSGLGGMIMPIIMYEIVNAFTLHGTLLIFGAFMMQTVVFSCLFRPLTYYGSKTRQAPQENQDSKIDRLEVVQEEEESVGENGKDISMHVDKNCNRLRQRQFSEESEKYASTDENLHRHRQNSRSQESLYYSPMNLALASLPDIPTALETMNSEAPQEEATAPDRSPRNVGIFRLIVQRFCYVKDERGEMSFLFSLDLLRNIDFVLIVGGVVLALEGFLITMIVPAHCHDLGFSKADAALVLSFQGGADTCGRLFTAFIGDCRLFKPYRSFALGVYILITGISVFSVMLVKNYYALTSFLVVGSFFFGAFVSLNPVLIIDIVGIHNLAKAWGIQLFFEGFSLSLSPLIMGALKDATGSYTSAYAYLCANFVIASCFVFILAWRRSRRPKT